MVTGIIVIVCIRTFQNGEINNLTSCLVWSLKLDNSVAIIILLLLYYYYQSIKPFVGDNAVILDLRLY